MSEIRVTSSVNTLTAASALHELELVDVSVTYRGAVPVEALRSISLTVDGGETIAVVGPSGSGKSTLLNVLGLLDMPTEGAYLVRGVEISGLAEADLTALRAQQFGFVFQSFHLINDRSAAENVELALLYRGVDSRTRRRAALVALERVGLSHRIAALPGTLSGGERQRVAIARALTQEPRILLCDEPTGNLDRRTSDDIVGAICGLASEGVTAIVVTHDRRVAAAMERCLLLEDGVMSSSTADD